MCGARLDPLHLDPGPAGSSICSFCGAPQPSRAGNGSALADPDGLRRISLAEASDTLREARERRGESLDHVAEATGIRENYLEELETGSGWFEPYPGRVYGRFFLREYAEHLGLDPSPLVEAFDGEAAPDIAPAAPVRTRRLPRLPQPRLLLALVGLIGLAVWGVILRGVDRESPAPGGDTVANVRPRDAAPHRVGRVPVDEIRAVATIEGPSWIEAVSDGRVIYRETAPRGAVVTFEADRRLELTLGNAGGVLLEVNGRPERTGSPGEVLHLAYRLEGGRLVSYEI